MDPPVFEPQYKQLMDALCKAGTCPRSVVIPKHSHISLGFSINTADKSVTNPVAEFIKAGK
jgi:triacylglycerol lipase